MNKEQMLVPKGNVKLVNYKGDILVMSGKTFYRNATVAVTYGIYYLQLIKDGCDWVQIDVMEDLERERFITIPVYSEYKNDDGEYELIGERKEYV